MKITFVDNLENTPARVNRETGEILLDRSTWFDLPEPYRKFILEHERGHYYLQTTNELLADQYAFEQLAGRSKGSLLSMVSTLADVLPFHSETHQARLLNLYRLALEWDQKNSPQDGTDQALHEVNMQLSSFTHNPQYLEYMELVFSKEPKGQPSDYEYSSYADPSLYEPTIGRRFHDVPMTEFERKYCAHHDEEMHALPVNSSEDRPVSLDLLPDMKTVRIDVRTVFIVLLIVLIVVGISKL